MKNRLLGLFYDIRHAYQGDREVDFVDNGVDEQIEKWHGKILPKENVHFKVNVLFQKHHFIYS